MVDTAEAWPGYDELLALTGAPPGSAWQAFGDGDQLRTINFLTPERVRGAAGLVRRGRVFNLDYPVNAFEPFPTGTRHPAAHHRFANNPHHRDDYLDSFYLQSSSQIDALRPIGHPSHGFYGGASGDEIDEGPRDLGIHPLGAARDREARGPARRAARHVRHDHRARRHPARPDGMGRVLPGLGRRLEAARHSTPTSPGLAQSAAIVRWLWEHQVAIVAADNVGPVRQSDFTQHDQVAPGKGADHDGMLHRPLIPLLGMALGGLWALDDLAEDCAADGIYEFLLVASPLNLIGGQARPPTPSPSNRTIR